MDAYLCVSIDCECDKGPGWRVKRPLAFAGITEGIGERLQPLFASFGAKPTYLLSPEVLGDPASVAVLRRLGQNAELGTHLHGEFVAPDAFTPDETSAFQCNYPPAVERAKLTALTDLFRDAFTVAPRSFRAGRFGIGPHSLGFLSALGYSVDSSVTPGKSWRKQGAAPADFRTAPHQPYWPDLTAPARIGAPGRLLEVPVTIRPRRLPLLGRWLEPRWLRPTKATVHSLVRLARDERTRAGNDRPVVLNAMFHNVEIMPGLSPYATNEDQAGAILAHLAGLLRFARAEGIEVVGLSEVAGLFAAATSS